MEKWRKKFELLSLGGWIKCLGGEQISLMLLDSNGES